MAVTINDVARRANVSKSTVSQFLNGRYEFMSRETRERIRLVIAEMGYRPNALARSLKQKKTHTLAAVVSSILNPFMTNTIRGVEDYCKEAGFNLILCNADDDPQQELSYIQTLAAKQIDGLVISTTGRNNEALLDLNRSGTPVVLFSRYVPEIGVDAVTVDNRKGVRMGIDHLLAKGRRDIAFFVMPYAEIPATPRRERAIAYQELIREHGLTQNPGWLVETPCEEAVVAERIKAMVNAPGPKPTAIFGANDLMTMAVVRALVGLGIRSPEQMAVIGFDDWEWAPYLKPAVTVVAQPSYEMGRRAAERLVGRIRKQYGEAGPELELYEPELIVRESCGEDAAASS